MKKHLGSLGLIKNRSKAELKNILQKIIHPRKNVFKNSNHILIFKI